MGGGMSQGDLTNFLAQAVADKSLRQVRIASFILKNWCFSQLYKLTAEAVLPLLRILTNRRTKRVFLKLKRLAD